MKYSEFNSEIRAFEKIKDIVLSQERFCKIAGGKMLLEAVPVLSGAPISMLSPFLNSIFVAYICVFYVHCRD